MEVIKKLWLLLGFQFYFLLSGIAQSSGLEAYWDDGLKFRSKDGRFQFSAGGRVHYDVAFITHAQALDSLAGEASDNVEVRRARLSFEGSINNALAYEFEFTFGETIEYADMYFAFLNVPYLDRLTVGHFREPFGMEELTSSNSIVFMERSLTSVFGPSRNTGIMLQKRFLNDKLKGYAGFFRITNDLASDELGQGKHSFSTRWVATPVVDTSTNKVLHVGAALNMYAPVNRVYKIQSSNEVNTAPDYINTGNITHVKRVTQLGGEIGYSKNRLTLQGEYIHSLSGFTKDTSAYIDKRRLAFYSFYATASYFLKHGKRKYNSNRNNFGSIDITKEYKNESLKGAWEAGLRVSQLSIPEQESAIEKLSDITLGINWYYNTNTRMMMNYVFSVTDKGYTANAVQFRIQLTF